MDNVGWSLEKLSQRCSSAVAQDAAGAAELLAVDSSAVVTDKSEFLVADYLASGDDAVEVESAVVVVERRAEQYSSGLDWVSRRIFHRVLMSHICLDLLINYFADFSVRCWRISDRID